MFFVSGREEAAARLLPGWWNYQFRSKHHEARRLRAKSRIVKRKYQR